MSSDVTARGVPAQICRFCAGVAEMVTANSASLADGGETGAYCGEGTQRRLLGGSGAARHFVYVRQVCDATI